MYPKDMAAPLEEIIRRHSDWPQMSDVAQDLSDWRNGVITLVMADFDRVSIVISALFIVLHNPKTSTALY